MKKLICLAALLVVLSMHAISAQNKGQEFPLDNFVFFPPKIIGIRQDITVEKTHYDFTGGSLWQMRQLSSQVSNTISPESQELLKQFEHNFAKYERELLPETTTWYEAIDAQDEDGDPTALLMEFYQSYNQEPNKYLLKDALDIQKGASGVFLWGYLLEQYVKNKRKDVGFRLCFMVVRRGTMKTVYEKKWDLKLKAWQKEPVAKKQIKTIYDKFKFYMKYYYR